MFIFSAKNIFKKRSTSCWTQFQVTCFQCEHQEMVHLRWKNIGPHLVNLWKIFKKRFHKISSYKHVSFFLYLIFQQDLAIQSTLEVLWMDCLQMHNLYSQRYVWSKVRDLLSYQTIERHLDIIEFEKKSLSLNNSPNIITLLGNRFGNESYFTYI